ncbi:MAG: pantoate--beta-alanine ligase [Saprospiraceae bacterium]
MIIFKRVAHLQNWVRTRKKENKVIGFIPTMGALHQGHLSLADKSKEECDITIVSIFVNPKQFNDPQDLLKYPRPIDEDLRLLLHHNIDVLFLPDVEDIYPSSNQEKLDFEPGELGNVMEGKFRPGHFAGVAEVMYRLLNIVSPDRLFMGQKDFQQLTIVRKLIHDAHLPVLLLRCLTSREPNGLAMSSRNLRLSSSARKQATIIFQTLQNSKIKFDHGESIEQIKKEAISELSLDNFKPEYFSIVDGLTLADINDQSESGFVVACCAVHVEGIRLIDNMIWKENK